MGEYAFVVETDEKVKLTLTEVGARRGLFYFSLAWSPELA